MARSQANLQFRIFRSLQGLSAEAKLLYVEILVDPAVNQSGLGPLRIGRWARELELDEAVVEKALAELDAREFVLTDPGTDEILVRTLIRNDGVASQPNVLRSALRAAVLCESPRLRRALAAELRKLPPAPPPSTDKKGRPFRYPDPHETAAELDPEPPEDPAREPFSQPFSQPFEEGLPEPLENPSGTLPEATEMSDSGTLRGTLPGRVGGGGGGGGGGEVTSVGGSVGGSRARTRRRAPAREAPTPAPNLDPDNPRCAAHAHIPATDRGPACHACGAVRRQLTQHTPPDTRRAELDARAAARQACARCDDYGWLLEADGTPAEPARRCDHRADLRAVPAAEAS